MLEGSRRNREIFIRISKEMENCGFCKSGDQCSCKIKKLRFEYKKIKDSMGKTGRGRKNWKYFEAMDQVLGHKPATCPPVVIESGESSMSCDPEPSAPSPTSLSSSILNETKDSILEEEMEYLDLVHKTGMISPDQEAKLPYLSKEKIERGREVAINLRSWKFFWKKW